MPNSEFYLSFDRIVQMIYEFKAIRLSQLLIEEDDVQKNLLRGELSQLDEQKQVLYSLNCEEIEPFMEALQKKYSLI